MEKDTIYRVSVNDFLDVMEAKHPELSEETQEKILELARQRFSINGVFEDIAVFIDVSLESFEKK